MYTIMIYKVTSDGRLFHHKEIAVYPEDQIETLRWVSEFNEDANKDNTGNLATVYYKPRIVS